MEPIVGQELVTLLSELGDHEQMVVRCPRCKQANTHVRKVGCLFGDNHEHVSHRRYDGVEPVGISGHRRAAVEITFTCEHCIEPFALRIQQYKGTDFIELHYDSVGSPQPNEYLTRR